jgi:hypothetical protein
MDCEQQNPKEAQALRHLAQACARDAAPYVHSRHTSAVVRHELAVTELSDEELVLIAGRAKVINGDTLAPAARL